MYIQCLELDDCGFTTYLPNFIDDTSIEPPLTCPECSAPVVSYTDEYWQNQRWNISAGLTPRKSWEVREYTHDQDGA